jgi:hypothetical protein
MSGAGQPTKTRTRVRPPRWARVVLIKDGKLLPGAARPAARAAGRE